MTGYGGLANLGVRTARSAIDVALDAAADDPNLDFILYTGLTLPAVRPPDEAMAAAMETRLDWFAQRVASSPIPVIPVSSTCVDLAGYGQGAAGQPRPVPAARAERLDRGDRQRAALGGEPRQHAGPPRTPRPRRTPRTGATATGTGHRLRPVVGGAGAGPADRGRGAGGARRSGPLGRRGGRARAPGGAAGRAQDLLRADHPQVRHRRRGARPAHRGRGPGRLREGPRGRRRRARRARSRACWSRRCAPAATELLAGVTVDPGLGPVLAVGLGGVWVEVLRDTALRVLPPGPPR